METDLDQSKLTHHFWAEKIYEGTKTQITIDKISRKIRETIANFKKNTEVQRERNSIQKAKTKKIRYMSIFWRKVIKRSGNYSGNFSSHPCYKGKIIGPYAIMAGYYIGKKWDEWHKTNS